MVPLRKPRGNKMPNEALIQALSNYVPPTFTNRCLFVTKEDDLLVCSVNEQEFTHPDITEYNGAVVEIDGAEYMVFVEPVAG